MCSWIDYCYDAVNQQIGLLVISIRLLVKLCIVCAKNVPWRPEVFLANNSQLDNFTARDHWAIGKDFENHANVAIRKVRIDKLSCSGYMAFLALFYAASFSVDPGFLRWKALDAWPPVDSSARMEKTSAQRVREQLNLCNSHRVCSTIRIGV